jgi:phage repressor protein C with HTH and peptisase S24 domain
MVDPISSTIVDMRTGIGERLKAERRAAGLSQQQLADEAGVSKQAVSAIETGATVNPEAATLDPFARRLGIRTQWLLSGTGSKRIEEQDEPDVAGWSDVLGYSQAVGLGHGMEAQEYAETHKLKFRRESLARKRLNPASLAVMYGAGDSMLPRIHSGDAILFDTSDTRPADENLYVIMAEGVAASEYSVKRCRHFGDDIYFDALNPEGDHNWRKPRKMTDKRHPIKIIGRVRWIGSWEG